MKNNLTILLSVYLLVSCGTHGVKDVNYIEVGRGEKALLITNNRDEYDFVSAVIDKLFNLGKKYREDVEIVSVDNENYKRPLLKANQHVLVNPGQSKIGIVCKITNGWDDPEEQEYKQNIVYDFVGGVVYEINIRKTHKNICLAEIKTEKNKYNKAKH